MKKQISLLLAALLLLTLLVGCGGSGSAKPAATGYAYDTDASTAPEALMAMPTALNGSMLAMEYGGDTECMAQSIFLTTLMSIITIPVLAALL